MRISANWLQKYEQRLHKIKLLQTFRINSKVQSSPSPGPIEGISKTKQTSRAIRLRRHWLRRGSRKDYMHSGTFQEAIKPILVLAQVFSLMPVRGVTSKSVHHLSFAWTNFRSIYAMATIACFGFSSCMTIGFAFQGSMNFDSVETIIFYTSIFLIAVVFFNLARKWPTLVVQWDRVERNLPPLRTERERSQLAHRIKMIALVTTMCSLVEHLLSMLSIIYYVNACPALPGHPINSYLYSNFSQFFFFFDYSTVAGIFGKVVNVLSTFAWNFNDIFVMAISVALSSRFRQLNDHMRRAVKRPTTAEFWIRCRINYRNLCRLCDTTDDAIATITMLCFTNNLYFICGKILKSLQKKPTFTHTLYFWFSLAYLLVRTFVLSLFAAEINDESKRPLVIFRCISRNDWCAELKRFSEEVNTDVVALSGMKFFQITRGLVLSVAGTIVTYELVLLQFNKQDKVNDCFER